MVNTPEQPVCDPSAWPCWSWTSTNVAVTRLQSIAPSSGSVTVIVYGMLWPQSKKSPSTGVLMVTVGLVLPAVIVTDLMSVLPPESVTVSLAT